MRFAPVPLLTAAALADIEVAAPVNGTVEVAGPAKIPLDKLAREVLAASEGRRPVIADVHARYFRHGAGRSIADARRLPPRRADQHQGLAQPLLGA